MALQIKPELMEAISTFSPSPTLNMAQNVSVWMEQNKNVIQGMSKEDIQNFQDITQFMQSVDMRKIHWACSWPELRMWKHNGDYAWSSSDTFIMIFECLGHRVDPNNPDIVNDPYINEVIPGFDVTNWEHLCKLEKIGFTFQELMILMKLFWDIDTLIEERDKRKKEQGSLVEVMSD